ncbi:MAG TPA: DUF3137 domain-containing protein [Patescibacteria group bacterium]
MEKKTKLSMFVLGILAQLVLAQNAWARGGGGGSGGGGGGGFSGGHSFSSSGNPANNPNPWIFFPVFFLIVGTLLFFLVYGFWRQYRNKKKEIAEASNVIAAASQQSGAWDMGKMETRVAEVFNRFQQDWSNFNAESMQQYLSDAYYRRMVLELNVLQNEGRRNIMEDVQLHSVKIIDAIDESDDSKDKFTAEISASAHDVLFDTANEKQLYADSSPFTEYWDFVRDGEDWRLDLISQETEDARMKESAIEDFANRNGFFYDPDFGWLMMPDKGVIFRRSNFQTSDINNHVIGYFRDKIVEFYTFIPNVQRQGNSPFGNYIVAQAVIPKAYKDILVRRKRKLFNFTPLGLERIHTESNDFENRFCLWASPGDQVSSLELLTPNFMEKVYALSFELNIEVVGNFLYLYAKKRQGIDYDQMLEIISWAFDEMER